MPFSPVIVSILSLLGMIALLFAAETGRELFSCLAWLFCGLLFAAEALGCVG
jgi:Cu/Ag efflux pump CusA